MKTHRIIVLAVLALGLSVPAIAQDGAVDKKTEAKLMMELESSLARQAPAAGQQPSFGQSIDWDASVMKLGSLLARAAGTRVEPHVLFHLGHSLYNAGQIEEARATFEDLSTRFANHPLVKVVLPPDEKSVVAQALEDCSEEISFRKQHGSKALPKPVLDKNLTLTLHFDAGDVKLQFYSNAALKHRENFIKLAKQGYYDRTRVHRVVPSRFVALGDPNSRTMDYAQWGRGGPETNLPSEFSLAVHKRGTVTMFRAPGRAGSHGSQFQILLADQAHLDFAQTPFAEVIEGIEIMDQVSSRSRNQFEAPVQHCFLNGVSVTEHTKKQ